MKTYVVYEGSKYNKIAEAVKAISDEAETAEITIYDIDGYHMTETLERNRHSGDFEYLSYYILTAEDYDVICSAICTASASVLISVSITS